MTNSLSGLLQEKLTMWVEVDGFEGFEVEVNYLSRDKLNKLLKAATRNIYDRKMQTAEPTVDHDLFAKLFVEEALTNWKGLTFGHGEELLPINVPDGIDKEVDEIEYSTENAITLVTSSVFFDRWLNDIVSDLQRFRRGTTAKTTGDSE